MPSKRIPGCSPSRCGLSLRIPAVRLLALPFLIGVVEAQSATLRVPEDFETIRSAVDAAGNGDTVSVGPGIYTGPGNRDIDFHGKRLLLEGRECANRTTLDCEESGRGFYLDSREEGAVIRGLTIANGDPGFGAYGGGAYVVDPTGVVEFSDCVFRSCYGAGGGAVFLVVAGAEFRRCVFIGNDSFGQGGGAVRSIGAFQWIVVNFTDCVFTGNNAVLGGGGALLADSGPVNFTGCTITRNRASTGGGIKSYDAPVSIDRSIVLGNCAVEDEGEDIFAFTSVSIACSDINTAEIDVRDLTLGEGVFEADPIFCDPRLCGAPSVEGDYTIRSDSPCLPGNNDCGVLVGAFGVGCSAPDPEGACCLQDGACVLTDVESCLQEAGEFLGPDTTCDPNPCIPTAREKTTWGRIRAGYR